MTALEKAWWIYNERVYLHVPLWGHVFERIVYVYVTVCLKCVIQGFEPVNE